MKLNAIAASAEKILNRTTDITIGTTIDKAVKKTAGKTAGKTATDTMPSIPDLDAIRASASQACALLKILANEDRLLILCQLSQGSRNVGELKALLAIRQPTLSQQLTVLREEGLVATERRGKYIYYSLVSVEVMHIMETLFELYCDPHQKK